MSCSVTTTQGHVEEYFEDEPGWQLKYEVVTGGALAVLKVPEGVGDTEIVMTFGPCAWASASGEERHRRGASRS